MKNSFIILLSIISFCALAQTRQNINKNTGTVSNVLTTIDSIRFNGSSTTMEVVLQNGTIESHSISDIQNVNFASAEHSCGADSVHNPNLNYGTMTDQEGNVYKTIVIGSQEWMAENLKTSIYRNGDTIANLSEIEWISNSSTQIGAWAFYNNDIQYECPYGKLYNWYVVADPRHVCPAGWHVPTDLEWNELIGYIDPSYIPDVLNGIQSSIAGGKMKTMSSQYWTSPNNSATNESGFSGLSSGNRGSETASFDNIGSVGIWWSFSESGVYFAWKRLLNFNSGASYRSPGDKDNGFSVRCLKD